MFLIITLWVLMSHMNKDHMVVHRSVVFPFVGTFLCGKQKFENILRFLCIGEDIRLVNFIKIFGFGA